jgi:hypothetical protein
MKTSFLRLLIIFLVAALSAKVMAGTISGNIAYTGTSTGQITVAAFQAQDSTVSLMQKSSPIVMVQLNSPGIYSLTGLSDGTYYIVSVMGMDSQNNVKITDPWGLYGTLLKLTHVTIAGGNTVSGINLTLVDGTIENPNPFSNNENSTGTISGNISYTGTSTGQIIVAAFQAQDSTVSLMMKNNPIVKVQLNSPGIYSLTGLSDGTYYIVSAMAMDSLNIKITDPWGLYGTLVKLTPVTIARGNTVSGINLTLVDGTIKNPNPFANVTGSEKNTQIPNGGFEDWTGNNLDGGWVHCNAITKSTDHYPIAVGNYSIRLENNIALRPQCDAAGFAVTAPYVGYNGPAFPITGHPTSFCGYYKFLPQNNDTMTISLALYKNGVIVANSDLKGTATVANWTSFNIPISPYTTADSAQVGLCTFNYIWGIAPTGPYGNSILYVDNLSFDNLITSVPLSSSELPSKFNLAQNYPNPFNPSTTISFSLPSKSFVSLKIFDVVGREVATLVSQELSAGNYKQQWNANGMPSGVYFYRLQSGSFTETKKLILLK